MNTTFILGVACGVIGTSLIAVLLFLLALDKWYIGNLNEDKSDPENPPYYFMEISQGRADRLSKNSRVLLNVTRRNYVPETKITSPVMDRSPE